MAERNYRYARSSVAGRWMRQHSDKRVHRTAVEARRELDKAKGRLPDGGQRLHVYECRWTDDQTETGIPHWHIGRRKER